MTSCIYAPVGVIFDTDAVLERQYEDESAEQNLVKHFYTYNAWY